MLSLQLGAPCYTVRTRSEPASEIEPDRGADRQNLRPSESFGVQSQALDALSDLKEQNKASIATSVQFRRVGKQCYALRRAALARWATLCHDETSSEFQQCQKECLR